MSKIDLILNIGALFCIALVFIAIYLVFGYGYYEDQYMICNYNQTCQIVNIDDLNINRLEYNFKHNLNTFDLDK